MRRLLSYVFLQLRRFMKMLKTPQVTVQYPFVTRQLANLARAQLRLDLDTCNGCGECEKKCPVNAVKVFTLGASESMYSVGKNKVQQISIDYGACVLCGICVDICEPKALRFQKLELPVKWSKNSLFVNLVQTKVLPEVGKK